jgi:hypothetical protein
MSLSLSATLARMELILLVELTARLLLSEVLFVEPLEAKAVVHTETKQSPVQAKVE